MGFGETAAHMIFFIAVVLIASSVAATMAITTQKISLVMKTESEHVKNYLATSFEIINDPTNIPNTTTTAGTIYTFYIKNTGTTSFPFTPDTLTVVIDGTAVSSFTTNPNGELQPSQVGMINVTINLAAGDHKLIVVLYNGVSQSFEFRTY